MLTRRSLLRSAAALAPVLPPLLPLSSQDDDTTPRSPARLPPAILALSDRSHEAVPISLAEREHRIERARELLTKNHLDALVVCTGVSLTYFTGLEWDLSERLFAWVLPTRSAPFILCPAFEEARVRERMNATPPTLPSASTTRIFPWQEDQSPFALLARVLRDSGLATATLALDDLTPFAFADGLAYSSPTLSLRSGTPVTVGCRAIKSPAELALMQLANTITLSVYQAAWRSLSPGMTNQHVSALIAAAYRRCGVEGDASCEVGASSALPHGSLKPQTVAEGQVILLDDGCTVEGYQSDISRSFVLGKPTDRQQHVFEVVRRAQAAALAAARPGVPCEHIDAVARKIVTDAGFGPGYKFFSHRLGHGIGMDGHEAPYLVGGNPLPLAPGMCFSDEPGIYIPGEFGLRLEDDWHVTPDGAAFFTSPSPSLTHPFASS